LYATLKEEKENKMSPNQAIAYDFHGDTPFTVPFSQIEPRDIHVYLDLDTKVGKKTCGQTCSHCWFVNYEKGHDKSFRTDEGVRIKESLERSGFRVFARYTDSFAYNGDFMKLFGPAHNRSFHQELEHVPTETMKAGDAWTSGRPLLAENYKELLDLARSSGYGTISITFHGLIDENLELHDESSYPLKGVFSGSNTEKVIRRIQAYNSELPDNRDTFRINIGLTLGKHNSSRESIKRYAHYFNRLGVDTLRFNNFTDHGHRHPELQMNGEEIADTYQNIKWMHSNIQLHFQLAVSEDFGTSGIEVMGFPSSVGWCQAGRQLFTVIPAQPELIDENNGDRTEKIGDIVGCVNIFEPLLGALVRRVKTNGQAPSYELQFDHQAIDEFARKRVTGVYKNGCFARELLSEQPAELTAVARTAIARRWGAVAPSAVEYA
jgi:hypothetical protein